MRSAPSRLARLRAAKRRTKILAVVPVLVFMTSAAMFVSGPGSPFAKAHDGGSGTTPSVASLKNRLSRTTVRSKAAYIALSQIGDPYRYGSAGPNAFDCSGLTSYSYKAAGRAIPRTSSAQRRATRAVGRPIPGDLLFYSGHVEMYVGKGYVVAANQTGRPVNLHKLRKSGLIKIGRFG
jgi:cell wall-associated NlpC family hydrolase